MTLRIAALDPGASPTLCFLSHDNALSFAEGDALAGKTATGKTRPVPALCRAALFGFAGGNLPDLLVIEDTRGMPGDTRGSGELLTYCVGLFEGLATALEVRVRRVQPVTWKRHHGLIKADKDASRREACRVFPEEAHLFGLKKHHNRAEAALMAMWGASLAMTRNG